jgi:hypothetical protein
MSAHQAMICMGCWQQLHLPVPLRGVLSVPFPASISRPARPRRISSRDFTNRSSLCGLSEASISPLPGQVVLVTTEPKEIVDLISSVQTLGINAQ